jgi:hypothetical protein
VTHLHLVRVILFVPRVVLKVLTLEVLQDDGDDQVEHHHGAQDDEGPEVEERQDAVGVGRALVVHVVEYVNVVGQRARAEVLTEARAGLPIHVPAAGVRSRGVSGVLGR